MAIFLALGVGIAIGSSFVQGAIVEQQTRQLSALRQQFQKEVIVAQETRGQYDRFVNALDPHLVQTRLAGTHVALILTGDYPDALHKTREVLEQAGATIGDVISLEPTYPSRLSIALPTLLTSLKQIDPSTPQDASAILRVLGAALARGGQEAALAALEEAHLITVQTGDYRGPNDYVVVVGGAADESESRTDTVDVPLIAQLKSNGASVIEVEPLNAAVSYVPSLVGSDITTVDNVDTDRGRICLVLAFRAQRGNYGDKSTALSGSLPPPSAP